MLPGSGEVHGGPVDLLEDPVRVVQLLLLDLVLEEGLVVEAWPCKSGNFSLTGSCHLGTCRSRPRQVKLVF